MDVMIVVVLGNKRRRGSAGGTALEFAFLMPWFVFLFIGALDWGFFAHALISTESAARVAVLYTSKSTATATDQTTACTLALQELSVASNVPASGTCTSSPVVVTATQVQGPDGAQAAQVNVTYTTLSLIPIPGVLSKQFTFSTTLQMRLRS
jgi:Flp pilus assembly protein TadG